MKAIVANDVVEVFGQNRNNNREFTFKSSQKAVDILVSRIYKHKIRAIVRELCCNAIDAHVAAGTPDRPFSVTLPGSVDPRFIVRDFGPGLSEEQVETVYTRFFESTKDDSNDYIGALGLGCKVPFCLVDVYTVTSYQNGLMTSYTMFRKDGMLQFRAETMGVPTDEPDGLEVAVPVGPDQFAEFKEKAAAVLYWFDVRPAVPSLEEAFTHTDKEIYETINTDDGVIKVIKGSDHYGSSKSLKEYSPSSYGSGNFIRMGQIIYPVNEAVSPNRRGYSLVVDVPIGCVDIQAGREELSYDENTKAYLVERFKRVEKQVVDHFSKTVNEAPNIRAAMVAAQKCKGADLQIEMSYKGMPLGSSNYAWPSSMFDVRVEKINTLHGVEIEYLEEGESLSDVFDDEDDDGFYCDPRTMMKKIMSSGHFPVAFAGDRLKLTHQLAYYNQDMDILMDNEKKLRKGMTLIYLLVDDDTNISRKLTDYRKVLRKEFANKHDLVALVIMRSGNNSGQPHHSMFNAFRQMAAGVAPAPVLDAEGVKKVKAVLDPTDRVVLLSELKSTTKECADIYILMRKDVERSFNHRANWRATKAPDKPVLYWPMVNGTLEHCANRRNRSEWGPGKLDRTLTQVFQYIEKNYAERFGKDIYLVPGSRQADMPEGSINVPQLLGALFKQRCSNRRWLKEFTGYLTGRTESAERHAHGLDKLREKLVADHPIHWLVEQSQYERANTPDFKMFDRLLWLFKHPRYEAENEILSKDARARKKAEQALQRKAEIKQRREANKHSRKKRVLTRIEQIVADYPIVFNGQHMVTAHLDDVALYANAKFEAQKVKQGE